MPAHSEWDPGKTGFYDFDRMTSGSSYHERMVRRTSRRRAVIVVAVALGVALAVICGIVVAGGSSVKQSVCIVSRAFFRGLQGAFQKLEVLA